MGKRNPITGFWRELRFLSYSYNFERDHAKKNFRLIIGGLLFTAGIAATFFGFSRDLLTPWVTGGVALFGLFLFLTADDAILSRRDMVSESISAARLDQARTTGIYSGFAIEDDGNGDYYLYSASVNRLLMEKGLDVTLNPKPFTLDSDLRKLAPYVMSTSRTPKGKRLFNREVRLVTDIIEPVFRTGEKVVLQPTDYVSGTCTNELALTTIRRRDGQEVLLNGLELFLEDRVVRSLDHSRCANLIGINSLVVLAGGDYLVRQQTKPYAANFGQLVPFVSASLSLDDYVASLTLQQMVSSAIVKRLCQETGYTHPELVRTAVIGYVRLLPRGGKPEFLALTVVNDTLENFITPAAIKKHDIRVPYPLQVPQLRSLDGIATLAASYNREHFDELSIQMKASVHALDTAARDARFRELLGQALGLG